MLLSAVLALVQSRVLVKPRSVKLEATLVRALGRVLAEPCSVALKTALVRALERAMLLLEPRSVELKAVSRVLAQVAGLHEPWWWCQCW